MLNTSIIILGLFVLAFGGFAIYDLATAKRRKEVYRAKSTVTAYLMLLPSVGLAFLFILLPILYSLGYAFTDYYLLRPNDIKFIFLENFAIAAWAAFKSRNRVVLATLPCVFTGKRLY